MSSAFSPIEEFDFLCRFCGKVYPVQLDRCIAENGRTVDRNSTFEYYCTKCLKTFCFKGVDLLEKATSSESDSENSDATDVTTVADIPDVTDVADIPEIADVSDIPEDVEVIEPSEEPKKPKRAKRATKSKKDKASNENALPTNIPSEMPEYSPKNHYHLGEWILHTKFKERGLIIGVENGSSNKIIVNFEKSGIKKLIEDI